MNQTLYKKSKSGKIQAWTIQVSDDSFRTMEGFLDGAITPTEWTKCTIKNEGKAHATTPKQQAEREALARVQKQRDKGWVDSPEAAEVSEVGISPMLAHNWNDHKDKIANDTILASQPKLDGVRCIANYKGLFTRNGKPIVSVPHIWEEVNRVFDLQNRKDFNIDGELYNHDLKSDFNKLISIAKKQKPDSADLEAAKQLQYHIYDIEIKQLRKFSFVENWAVISSYLGSKHYFDVKYLKQVSTTFLTISDTKLDHLYSEYLQQGYEGQMVRLANSTYENCRSKNLLKRKEFIDEEFLITGVEEGLGNRSGMMGRVNLVTAEGKKFDSSARGTMEYYKELLHNKEAYIGKKATVRYQNLTPDGIPRFPVIIQIDRID